MDELKKLMAEATDTRRAYREACGVGVIDDSAASLVAMMNTDGPELKAMRAATDALNRAAVNALPELIALREENERLNAALNLVQENVEASASSYQVRVETISRVVRAALNQEPTPTSEP